MRNEIVRKELVEAVQAGERALVSLKNARNKLENAKNGGLWDMFGGGLFSTIVKHSNLDQANVCLKEAERDLKIFQRELKDVSVPLDIRMNIGDFLAFADFFMDGILVDAMVQSRIREARSEVDGAILRVERLLMELRQYDREVQ